jgi:hypothetical protein
MTTRKKKNKDKSQADFKEFSITRKLKNTNARIKNNEQGDLQVGGTNENGAAAAILVATTGSLTNDAKKQKEALEKKKALEQDYTEINENGAAAAILVATTGSLTNDAEKQKEALEKKQALEQNYTKIEQDLSDLLSGITIYKITIGDDNSNKENNLSIVIFEELGLGKVTSVGPDGDIYKANLIITNPKEKLDVNDIILSYTVYGDEYIYIHNKEFFDKTKTGSVTINFIKYDDLKINSDIENKIKARIKAKIVLDQVVKDEKSVNKISIKRLFKKAENKGAEDNITAIKRLYKKVENKEAEDRVSMARLSRFIEDEKIVIGIAQVDISGFKFSTHPHNGEIANIDSGSMKDAGLEVGDIIVAYQFKEQKGFKKYKKYDLENNDNELFYEDFEHYGLPVHIMYIKKDSLDESKKTSLEKFLSNSSTQAKEAIQKQDMKPSSVVDSTTLAIVGTVADLINQKAPQAKETPATKEAKKKQEMKPSSVVDSTTLAIVGTVADLINQKAPATKKAIEKLIADCEKFKKEFETFKKKKTKDENELMKIMKIINELLNNKQTLDGFEKEQKADLYESVTNAIQTYTKLINEIMSYLNDNFSIKYQWIEIVDSKDPIYNRKTGIINKLYKNSNDGLWTFEVWIPQPNKSKKYWSVRARANEISLINEPTAVNKTLQVKTISGEIIDTYVTGTIIVNSSRFLVDKKYDITNEVNYQPDITNANNKVLLGKNFMSDTYSGVVTEPIKDLVKGTVRRADKFIKDKSKRGLREELKEYIGSIIDTEFQGDQDQKLLQQIIRFENTKQPIRTVLVNKISHIFSEGETRFNLFNKESLKKNFADDNNNITEEDELKGGPQEGGGIYGFRNFDKHDARKFLIFILTNLKILIDGKNGFQKNINNLLLTTYLKTLFSKIGPPELNKLLPDIDNIQAASKHVINHFIGRLKKNSDTVKAGEAAETAETAETNGLEHAEAISKLNFELKRNVKSFMSAIVDIALHTDELTGTKEKIADYLDKEYDKAMNIPFGDDKTRIENLEINNALRQILGPNLNSIKGYRTKIKEIDDLIDSITVKNINEKLKKLAESNLLNNIALGKGTITHTLPDKIATILEQNIETAEKTAEEEKTTKEELAVVKGLVEEVLTGLTLDGEKQAKSDRLMRLIRSPPAATHTPATHTPAAAAELSS